MIKLKPSKSFEPDLFRSSEFQEFRRELWHFNLGTSAREGQHRFPWRDRLKDFRRDWRAAFAAEPFFGKCAYSEEKLDPDRTNLVLHRPAADALGLDQELVDPDHYWWLIAEWTNWYPAAPAIALVKGTQFPVVGRRSPRPGRMPKRAESRDLGLLLDPCSDEPAWHLKFDDTGRVEPRDHPNPEVHERYDGYSRGEATMKILDLNNQDLITARTSAIRKATELAEMFSADFEPGVFEKALASDREFSGCIRQQVARSLLLHYRDKKKGWPLAEQGRELVKLLTVELAAELAGEKDQPRLPIAARRLLEPVRTTLEREQWQSIHKAFPESEASFTQTGGVGLGPGHPPAGRAKPALATARTTRIARVEITNFKAIHKLDLEFSSEPVELLPDYSPNPDKDTGQHDTRAAMGWKVLLGENGSGKSCFLQAVGLALAGDDLQQVLDRAGLRWSDMLRRGARQGRVTVHLKPEATIELRFTSKGYSWGKGSPKTRPFIRGYGPTRLLATEGDNAHTTPSAQASEARVRLANLYDPHAEVVNAKRWLLSLNNGDFNVAALTIGRLLHDEELAGHAPSKKAEKTVTRDRNHVYVEGDPLDYVSDGYRSVIAIICDIMAGLGKGFGDMGNAPGIVLIDEIGAHLHPRWRMAITSKLRHALPSIQFLVSTHEPLCLRGLQAGEVVRVRKTPTDGVTVEESERSPSRYRVDQLLTSEFFGLDTTIDPDLDRRFQVYYQLLALTEAERTETGRETEFQGLKEYIEAHGGPVLGHTRRDQLVYEAIDQFLSEERQLSSRDRKRRRAETLKAVRDIWRPGSQSPLSSRGRQ